MTQATPTESFVSFVDRLDPHDVNGKGSMLGVFERYSDLSAEVSSLPKALARAIALSDTNTLAQIADALGHLTGEYQGHLQLG
jgi:hypothetical protein